MDYRTDRHGERDMRGRRSAGGMIFGVIAIVVVAVLAWWLFAREPALDRDEARIEAAADKVGAAVDDTARDAGRAADNLADDAEAAARKAGQKVDAAAKDVKREATEAARKLD